MIESPGEQVVNVIVRLLSVQGASERAIGDVLGIQLRRVLSVKPIQHFEGRFDEGPLDQVSFRTNTKTGLALVALGPRQGAPAIYARDMDMSGVNPAPPLLDVNPNIPPEGGISHIYDAKDVRVSIQYTASTKRFLGAALHWSAGS